jgi:hypothetical protein
VSIDELLSSGLDLTGLDDERFLTIARDVVAPNHKLYKRLA